IECAPEGKLLQQVLYYLTRHQLAPGRTALYLVSGVLGIIIFLRYSNFIRVEELVHSSSPVWHLSVLTLILLIPIIYMLLEWRLTPSHFGIGTYGVRLHWLGGFIAFRGNWLPWEQIRKIRLTTVPGARKLDSRVLGFYGKNKIVELRLDRISNPDDLSAIAHL